MPLPPGGGPPQDLPPTPPAAPLPEGQKCKETAGFLFAHPCKNPAAFVCTRCGRPVCVAHMRVFEGERMCVSCEKQAVTARQERGEPLPEDYQNDPYYSAWYWYPDYHHYSHSHYGHHHREAFQSTPSEGWESDLDAS